jgi:hypothetical protein
MIFLGKWSYVCLIEWDSDGQGKERSSTNTKMDGGDNGDKVAVLEIWIWE